MINSYYPPEEISSLDELIKARLAKLSEKLAQPHTLEDLESEIKILNELVESFKFRDEMLKKFIDDTIPASRRKQVTGAMAAHAEIIRQNAERVSELTSKSRQLIEKSGWLFAKLAVEKPVANSSLIRHRNLLLAALPVSNYVDLIPKLERVSISQGKVVCHADEPIRYVYFPETAVFSIVTTMKNGASVEVGIVGNDGMLGVRVLFGSSVTPNEASVQVGGAALRMKIEVLRDELGSGGLLQKLLLTYAQVMITQLRQSGACKNFHSVERRLARWLLTIEDYAESRELVLTQSQMAHAIGSRLAGVSEAASKLQKAGLIRYSRGHIKILDRRSLEAASCECYKILRSEIQQLYSRYVNAAKAIKDSA